ncbi:MAG: winged helix-turn-helix transcriptional regulator [Spirochaetia bacterium]|nr:winged helix-turn-helix transcriptional regulator [Spirochaetia bacterium]
MVFRERARFRIAARIGECRSLHREVYPQVPPKVEYSLTPFGKNLQPTLLLMKEWGDRYTKTLVKTKQASLSSRHAGVG